eukprot:scaffold29919_cov70-Cyclotella_meneghiniana.AAC.18
MSFFQTGRWKNRQNQQQQHCSSYVGVVWPLLSKAIFTTLPRLYLRTSPSCIFLDSLQQLSYSRITLTPAVGIFTMSSPPDMTSPPDDPEMPPFKGPPAIPQLRDNELHRASQPLSFRQSKSLSYRLRNTDIFAETLRRKITSNGTTSVNWRHLGVECGKCFNAIPTRAFPLWCAQPRDGSLNDEGGSKQGGEGDGSLNDEGGSKQGGEGDGSLNDEGGSKQGGEEGGYLVPALPPLPPVEELFSPFDEVITSPILTSSAPSLLRQLCATTHKQLHLEVTPSQALMELSEGWNNEETIEGWAREYQITCEPPPSDLKMRKQGERKQGERSVANKERDEHCWNERCDELSRFVDANNRFPTQQASDKIECSLAQWLSRQRGKQKNKKLSEDQVARLDELDIV